VANRLGAPERRAQQLAQFLFVFSRDVNALELARERREARIEIRTRKNRDKGIIPVLCCSVQGEPNLAVDPIDNPVCADNNSEGSGAGRDGFFHAHPVNTQERQI
jgi:hypothetical protein